MNHISKGIYEKSIDTIVTIDSVRYCINVHYCSTTIVPVDTIVHVAWFFPAIIVVTSNVTQKYQRRISRLFVSGFYALNTLYGTCVKWEFWFTNEISKRRLENALLTEQIEHQVPFCTATSRLLHDDAKIHARWRGFITSWKIGGRWKQFFGRNILIRTDDLLSLFDISIRYD